MKKFVIIFAFALLASCQTTSEKNFSNTSESGAKVSIVASGAMVGEKIKSDAGYMQCIESSRYNCGIDFVNSYALNNSDEKICQEFSDESLRIACTDMVVTETAKKTLDETRCNVLSDDKKALCIQGAITAKGTKNGDPTVCSNYVLASSDTDSLENMKDRCVIHVIDQLEPNEKTKGLCGLIINEGLQADCEQRIGEIIDFEKNRPQENNENPENQ